MCISLINLKFQLWNNNSSNMSLSKQSSVHLLQTIISTVNPDLKQAFANLQSPHSHVTLSASQDPTRLEHLLLTRVSSLRYHWYEWSNHLCSAEDIYQSLLLSDSSQQRPAAKHSGLASSVFCRGGFSLVFLTFTIVPGSRRYISTESSFLCLQPTPQNYWQLHCRGIDLTDPGSCWSWHYCCCYCCCCCCWSCCWGCWGCWRWYWEWWERRPQRRKWRSSPGQTLCWRPGAPDAPFERTLTRLRWSLTTSLRPYCVSTCLQSPFLPTHTSSKMLNWVIIPDIMFPPVLSRCHIFEENQNFSHN